MPDVERLSMIRLSPQKICGEKDLLLLLKVLQSDDYNLVLKTKVSDNSRRQTVDLDQVIRSNTANACTPRLDEADCEANMCYNALYRTMDGTCNNMKGDPLRGSSYRPYTRLLPTIYDNEVSEPVGKIKDSVSESNQSVFRIFIH